MATVIESLLIILGVMGVAVVGFVAGVRYGCSDRVLPGVLARMSSERLNGIAARAGEIRLEVAERIRNQL